MNIKQYQKETLRTMPNLGVQMDLVHMVLGLGSEVSELQEAIENEDIVNIGEELTDIMWYLSNYHNLREYEMIEGETNTYYNIMDLTHSISVLQDYIKKFIAYGKEINPNAEKLILDQMLEILYSMYKSEDLDREECMAKNIAKLYERFPEGYNDEKALNRNLENERKILEEYYGDKRNS